MSTWHHHRHRRRRGRGPGRPVCSWRPLRRSDAAPRRRLPVTRDRGPRRSGGVDRRRRACATGREVERAGGRARGRRRWRRPSAAAPGAVRAARRRRRRRQPPPVLQPVGHLADDPRPVGFGAACIGFLWPRLGGGFGSKINVGKVDDIKAAIRGQQGLLLPGRGPRLDHRVPGERAREGPKPSYSGAGAGRHGGRRRRPLPEVPAPRLPRARVRHLAVVRVPVPRLAVQPRR